LPCELDRGDAARCYRPIAERLVEVNQPKLLAGIKVAMVQAAELILSMVSMVNTPIFDMTSHLFGVGTAADMLRIGPCDLRSEQEDGG